MTTNYNYPPKELEEELVATAKALIAPGKGILCADESVATMGKRFADIRCKNTEERRRNYRQLLFTTNSKINDYISGVILSSEAAFQTTETNSTFIQLLQKLRLIPGIKLDSGIVEIYGSIGEYTTQGLDDLYDRCAELKRNGIEFAKWRCVYKIGEHTPSYQAILQNATVLARYASICQSQGIVPIIEPDILTEGEHDIELSLKVTETVLAAVYKALSDHHVFLEGTLLKIGMVLPGMDCKIKVQTDEIALYTITAIRRTVPAAVPGILFLSGGQSEEDATTNLNAINQLPYINPWALTFSFGRALQTSVLRVWNGKMVNIEAAQDELMKRAKANSEASIGKYAGGITGPGATINFSNPNHAFYE